MREETLSELLKKAQETFEQRDKEYGSAYQTQGTVLKAYFQNGLHLETAQDFAEFALFSMVVGKANRWAQAFQNGHSHQDSLHDMGVYSFMLEEVAGWRKE